MRMSRGVVRALARVLSTERLPLSTFLLLALNQAAVFAAMPMNTTAATPMPELTVVLKSFSLSGEGRVVVQADCDVPPCEPFPSPDWEAKDPDTDKEGVASPVAFLSGTQVELRDVELEVSPVEARSMAWVTVEGPDGLRFDAPFVLGEGRGAPLLGALRAPTPLPQWVDAYEPLELSWTLALPGGHVLELGTTAHRVYLLLQEPLGNPLESLIAIGARAGAGATTLEEVVSRVWADFADREVVNASGDALGYYRGTRCPSSVGVYSAAGLVTSLNGQCSAWQDLLISVLRLQGVDSALPVLVEPQGTTDIGFLVREYAFDSEGGDSGCSQYPYVITEPCDENPWGDEAWDRFGTPGQDEVDPASFFGLHYMVKINGAYYDPSYGLGPFSGARDQAILEWETHSLAGVLGFCDGAYAARPASDDWQDVTFLP